MSRCSCHNRIRRQNHCHSSSFFGYFSHIQGTDKKQTVTMSSTTEIPASTAETDVEMSKEISTKAETAIEMSEETSTKDETSIDMAEETSTKAETAIEMTEETSTKETHAEETKETPAEGTLTKETPAEGTSTAEETAKGTSAVDTEMNAETTNSEAETASDEVHKVKAHPKCAEIFAQMKTKIGGDRFVIFKIEGHEIIVEETVDKLASWEDFVKKMSTVKEAESSRYVLYDACFLVDDMDVKKVVYIFWDPSESKDRKMYTTHNEYMKSQFEGLFLAFHFTEDKELDFTTIKTGVMKKIAEPSAASA